MPECLLHKAPLEVSRLFLGLLFTRLLSFLFPNCKFEMEATILPKLIPLTKIVITQEDIIVIAMKILPMIVFGMLAFLLSFLTFRVFSMPLADC